MFKIILLNMLNKAHDSNHSEQHSVPGIWSCSLLPYPTPCSQKNQMLLFTLQWFKSQIPSSLPRLLTSSRLYSPWLSDQWPRSTLQKWSLYRPCIFLLCWLSEMDPLSLPSILLIIGEAGKLKPHFSNPLQLVCWVWQDQPNRYSRLRFGM